MKTLIGIAGAAGAGKDTLAAALWKKWGYSTYAMATPLRAAVEAAFGLPRNIWDRETKEVVIPWIGASPRHLLQTLGTEWGRGHVSPDVWVRVAARVHDVGSRGKTFRMAVPDIRFDNEAEWIRSKGGAVILVSRNNLPAVRSHASEAGVSDSLIDLRITNDYESADEFAEQAILMVERELSK